MGRMIPEGVSKGFTQGPVGVTVNKIESITEEELGERGILAKVVTMTVVEPESHKGMAWDTKMFLGDMDDPKCESDELFKKRIGGNFGLKKLLDTVLGEDTTGTDIDEACRAVEGNTVGVYTTGQYQGAFNRNGQPNKNHGYLQVQVAEWFPPGEREPMVREMPNLDPELNSGGGQAATRSMAAGPSTPPAPRRLIAKK